MSSEPSSQLSPCSDAASKLRETLLALQVKKNALKFKDLLKILFISFKKQRKPPNEIAPVAKSAMEAVVGMLNQMRGGGAGGKAIDEVCFVI